MKLLFIIRHAKSSQKNNESISDAERPLNKRGERDAPFMAEILHRKGIIPDLIISSPALRALSTASHFAREFEYLEGKIQMEDNLYLAPTETIWEIVNGIDDGFDSVMMFGHNPGFTEFVNLFENVYVDNLPTCGIISIAFSTDSWSLCSEQNGKVLWVEYPKLYLV
jgi:phosphohistidine phosphatase